MSSYSNMERGVVKVPERLFNKIEDSLDMPRGTVSWLKNTMLLKDQLNSEQLRIITPILLQIIGKAYG